MLEFFKTYSIQDILIFIIMLAIAFKCTVDFVEWVKEKYNKKFNKDHLALNKEKCLKAEIEKYYEVNQRQHEETMQRYEKFERKLDTMAKNVRENIDKIEIQLAQLTESDKHDIKGWIVEKHHALIKKGWVDDFTMDTLERRYSDYVAEKGNSYISGLMSELRALPHFPDKEDE